MVEVWGGSPWANAGRSYSDRPCPHGDLSPRARIHFLFAVHTMSAMGLC